jgi:hypothetical protein
LSARLAVLGYQADAQLGRAPSCSAISLRVTKPSAVDLTMEASPRVRDARVLGGIGAMVRTYRSFAWVVLSPSGSKR